MKTYTIAIAIIEKDGKYLLGKRAPGKKFAPGAWEFISGFIDTRETAEDIILRELKEEIEVEGRIEKSGKPMEIFFKDERWIMLPFKVSIGTSMPKLNPSDHAELKWFLRSELDQLQDLKDDIRALDAQRMI